MTRIVLGVATVVVILGAAVILASDLVLARRARPRAVLETLLPPIGLGLLVWRIWAA